jgi:hypothetical protein
MRLDEQTTAARKTQVALVTLRAKREKGAMKIFHCWLALIVMVFLGTALSPAQNPAQNKNQSKPAASQTNQQTDQQASDDEQDEPVQPTADKLKANQSEALNTTWEILQTASDASKPKEHIGLLVALSSLSGYRQAETMILSAMKDGDVDIRLAAVTSAGTMKDDALMPALREAVKDQAPEVRMSAAVSLWKLQDHTGGEVLRGVLTGEIKGKTGLFKSSMHTANRDLHDPSELALLSLEDGGPILFGPIGIAFTAVKVVHPSPSANSARAIAAGLLAEDISGDTSEESKQALIKTMHDKDYYVRIACERALGKFQGKDVSDALLDGLDDPKPSVRYMAAASYIRVASPLKSPPKHVSPAKRSRKHA